MQCASKLGGPFILDAVHVFNSNSTYRRPIETWLNCHHVTFDQGHTLVIQQGGLMDRKSQPVPGAMGHGDGIARVVLARESKSKPVGFQSVDGGLVDGGSLHPRSQGSDRGLLGRHNCAVHALDLI